MSESRVKFTGHQLAVIFCMMKGREQVPFQDIIMKYKEEYIPDKHYDKFNTSFAAVCDYQEVSCDFVYDDVIVF